jgi:hypothetical protein
LQTNEFLQFLAVAGEQLEKQISYQVEKQIIGLCSFKAFSNLWINIPGVN